jgi:hypothetical protein
LRRGSSRIGKDAGCNAAATKLMNSKTLKPITITTRMGIQENEEEIEAGEEISPAVCPVQTAYMLTGCLRK